MSTRGLEWKRRFERGIRTAIVDYLRSVNDEYDTYRPGNIAQYYATRYTDTTAPNGLGLVQVGPIKLFESMFRDDGDWHTTYHTLSFSYAGDGKFDLEVAEVEDGGYYDPAPHYLNVHPSTGRRFGKRKKGR